MLNQIDRALPSINVHLATFSAPIRSVGIRHVRIVITLCASPSFIVESSARVAKAPRLL